MDYGVVDHGGGPHSRRSRVQRRGRKGRDREAGPPRDAHGREGEGPPRLRQQSSTPGPSTAASPAPSSACAQGDLVEVTLVNEDIEDGVTIHWHGLDVPNAEDGVAGVTQDAVLPGETLHLPLPPRAGRNLLVPHARGRLERREARALRGARDHASRKPPAAEARPRTARAHVLRPDRDRDRRRRPAARVAARHAGSAPAREHEQLARCGSVLAGMQASVVAIDGSEIEPAPVPGGRGDRGRRRRPLRHRLPDASGRRRAPRSCGSKAALVLSPDGTGEPPTVSSVPSSTPAARGPASARGASPTSTGRSGSRSAEKPGLPRRKARPPLVAEREALPAGADVHGLRWAISSASISSTTPEHPPDAPPRPPLPRPDARRQGGRGRGRPTR